MWTDSFHRFADRAAFLAACDAAGWPRGPGGDPAPPQGVALDIIGAWLAAPTTDGSTPIPGATLDGAFHVNASWYSGTTPPPDFAAAEIVPEAPPRTFAARDPAQKITAIADRFDRAKVTDRNDPRLVAKRARLVGADRV